MEKYKEAMDLFQKCIDMNYYYSSPHFHIGYLCARHGHFVPAMMALETFLVMEPRTKRSLQAITVLSSLGK